MKFLRSSSHRSLLSGFSLIELMAVIAVIGAITPLAVPAIGSMSGAARTAAAQDNAQNIVSIFRAGDAAQITWVTTSRNAAVADVVAGRNAPARSVFAGKTFSVPHLSVADLRAAYPYIGLDAHQQLFFDATGSQSAQ